MISQEEVKTEAKAFMSDGIDLVRKEVQLAKAEIYEKVNQVQTGLVSLVGGAIFGTGALIFFGHAAVAYLAPRTGQPTATLIVALVFLVIAVIMLMIAKSNLNARDLKPRRTIHAAQNIRNEFGGKTSA